MIIQRTYTSRLFKLKARVGRFRTGLADSLQIMPKEMTS